MSICLRSPYVDMFKLFQRNIFSSLTKEFLHVSAISYIVMLKKFHLAHV